MKTKIIRTSRGLRKVRVLRSGQYRFMKMTKKRRKSTRRTSRRTYRKSRRTRKTYTRRKRRSYSRSGGGLYD